MKNSLITVVIPSRRRPQYLRNALRSVARQYGINGIGCVRVLENSTDDSSRSVCDEFSDKLPIEYRFRNTNGLDFFGHFRMYLAESYDTKYIAILHDDDWWLPSHLEASIRAIESHGAVASYSSFFETNSESSTLAADANLLFGFAKGFAPTTEDWAMDFSDITVGSLAGTPGRYSALVVESALFKKTAEILDCANICDNDRMLPPYYAQHGLVAFNPLPTVCIRRHAEQDQRRFTGQDIIRWNGETTVWMFKQAKDRGVDLINELNRRIVDCPAEWLDVALQRLSVPWLYLLLRNHPRLPTQLRAEWAKRVASQARSSGST